MCLTLQFHYLCGHSHSAKTIFCEAKLLARPPTNKSSAGRSKNLQSTLARLRSCSGAAEELRLIAKLCSVCEQIGVIAEWLGNDPGRRCELIREWRRDHRKGDYSDDATAIDSDDTIGEAEAFPELKVEGEELVEGGNESTLDLQSLRSRMSAMRMRLEQQVAKTRTAQRVPRPRWRP